MDLRSDMHQSSSISIIPSPAVVSARRGHHHPPPEPITYMYTVVNLVDPDPHISSYSSQRASTEDVTWLVHCIWCSHEQPAFHTLSRQSESLSVLTGVLWYSTAQKWSLCYQKVSPNRVRVIRRPLCIKPVLSTGPKKIVCVIRGSVLSESVLTKFYCIFQHPEWELNKKLTHFWFIPYTPVDLL